MTKRLRASAAAEYGAPASQVLPELWPGLIPGSWWRSADEGLSFISRVLRPKQAPSRPLAPSPVRQ